MFYLISIPRNLSGVTAQGGVLDLRNEDFSSTIFRLDGEWEFYFGQLLTPQDFAHGLINHCALQTDHSSFINVPMSWDVAGYPLFGYATYRLIINTDEPELLLLVPEIMESSAVWVNGVLVFETGTVGRTQAESTAGIKMNIVNIRPENGLIEIIVQASNHSYMESGLAYSQELALSRVLLNDIVLRWLLVSIFIGLAFAMFIYHLMLFVYRNKERAYLIFALYCFFTAVRFAIASDSIISFLLPNGFGAGLYNLYLLSIIIQSVTVVLFAYTVFNIKLNSKFAIISYCAVYGFALLAALFPFGRLYVNFIFVIFIPMIVVIVKALRSKLLRESPYNILLVVSIGIFIVWAPLIRLFLDIPFMFMSGVPVNLFLLLSQCLMLSVSYSETKRREEQLAEEKALLEKLNRTKSIFYSNVNHEMKTPLTIIATEIQTAEKFIAQGNFDGAIQLMRDAWQETMKMADTVTDALEFARNQETAQPMGLFDFGELVSSTLLVFEPLAKKRDNTLKKEIETLPLINGNANMLSDALINLLYNANRHTEGGVILVQWKQENDCKILAVSDTGTGISPELLPHVLERGITNSGGSGLGLSIVKSIMEQHGGEVLIESEPGKGTVVRLFFNEE
jgi:signal transduction histidine kinase